jgi:hypothetical protein
MAGEVSEVLEIEGHFSDVEASTRCDFDAVLPSSSFSKGF